MGYRGGCNGSTIISVGIELLINRNDQRAVFLCSVTVEQFKNSYRYGNIYGVRSVSNVNLCHGCVLLKVRRRFAI